MTIRFTCRQTRLTPALRQFAEEKLSRLDRYLEDGSKVNMVLSVEKHRHQAEMTVTSPGRHFAGAAITDDLYTAIGLVLDKLGKQVRRDKRRRTDHRRRDTVQTREIAMEGNGDGATGPDVVREDTQVQPMTLEEAAAHLADSDRGFVVFQTRDSARTNVIFRRQDGRMGLIEG